MAATTLVSWNIARRHEPWRQLAAMDADVALLQEAVLPPPDVAGTVDTGPAEHWDSSWYEGRVDHLLDRWPMVVRLSDRVEVEWFRQVGPISETREDEIAVSGIGTIAAARVMPRDAPPFIVVSMYARWIKPHPSTGASGGRNSPMARRTGSSRTCRRSSAARTRARTVSWRRATSTLIYGATDDNQSTGRSLPAIGQSRTGMDALGMEFLGPGLPVWQARQPRAAHLRADVLPSPRHLAPTRLRSPAYHTRRARAQRRRGVGRDSRLIIEVSLDYAFASRGFHEHSVRTVRAMNREPCSRSGARATTAVADHRSQQSSPCEQQDP